MQNNGYLNGKLLVAMPSMNDPRFHSAVIYVCVHDADGAMGLVVNRLSDQLNMRDVLLQTGLPSRNIADLPLHYGGPVDAGRGFVLHSLDYGSTTTTDIDHNIGLTNTLDILNDMSEGVGPSQMMLALGYTGWDGNQLEQEIAANSWLVVDADQDLVFGANHNEKWQQAVAKLGVDNPAMLSSTAGSA